MAKREAEDDLRRELEGMRTLLGISLEEMATGVGIDPVRARAWFSGHTDLREQEFNHLYDLVEEAQIAHFLDGVETRAVGSRDAVERQIKEIRKQTADHLGPLVK